MHKLLVDMGSFHIQVRKADTTCDSSKCQECKFTCLDRLGKWYDKGHLVYKADAIRYPFKERANG
jgi:heterodisulfide reductase subunit A-like polyferredoxin